VVQDVAKKRKKKKGSNEPPREKKIGLPKNPSFSHKKYVFSRLTNFLFFFLLKFSFSEKAELYNCVDMIKKQPPGITCCLLAPCPQIFKKKKFKKIGVNKKKINEKLL